ncbi:hypothetical protein IW261DRAFT_879101 [Armillaria novae-zelandiae]|uniref:Uncharacterized protein n=1 Tax=Armillaria novae-zelandiae TaxID=153914 RepID=A0AA39UMP7_9AGAR|nr:hypothetical protein IW261DRAFT_879101 [Armillaria novae-zelandiae]
MESNKNFRHRYLQATAYHANESVKLALGNTSPAVMMHAQKVMKPQAEHVVDMYIQDKELVSLESRAKMDQKRMARPNRYKCAPVACGFEAVSEHVFSRCISSLLRR